MGKQFSVALAEFNQEQLNQIQNAVDSINNAVDEVGNVLDEIRDTDVAELAYDINSVLLGQELPNLANAMATYYANIYGKIADVRNTDVPALSSAISSVGSKVDNVRNTDVPALSSAVSAIGSKVDNVRNVDVPALSSAVSAVMSAMIESKIWMSTYATGSQGGSSELLDVSGSGVAYCIINDGSDVTAYVNIDNNSNWYVINAKSGSCYFCYMKFNNRLRLRSNGNYVRFVYALD